MSLLGIKRSRTTAYHPQSNGMVERFHRQLKAALKAQPNPDDWIASLPLVLLGIRTALKQDIHSTAAELVYGTNLHLSGEFFTPSPTDSLPNPSEFLNTLKQHFRHISPVSPRPAISKTYIPNDLNTATHIFVRNDAVRKPLQPPYHGLYPIIKHSPKHFTIKLNGRTDTISIDRLKPAHLDSIDAATTPTSSQTDITTSTPQPLPSAPTTTHTTRSCRRVKFPTYLVHNV